MHWFIADAWEYDSEIGQTIRDLAHRMRTLLRSTHVVAHQQELPATVQDAISSRGVGTFEATGPSGQDLVARTHQAWVRNRGVTLSQPYLVGIYRHPMGNGRNFVPMVRHVDLETRTVLRDGWWDVMACPAVLPMGELPWVFCSDANTRLSRRQFLAYLIYTQ
jgi:hypothetical protein